MWHIAIQKGQLEDVQASAQEEEAAARKGLRAHAAEQLHREEEAVKKAERNRLLRVRWVARTCGGPQPFSRASSSVAPPEPLARVRPGPPVWPGR